MAAGRVVVLQAGRRVHRRTLRCNRKNKKKKNQYRSDDNQVVMVSNLKNLHQTSAHYQKCDEKDQISALKT